MVDRLMPEGKKPLLALGIVLILLTLTIGGWYVYKYTIDEGEGGTGDENPTIDRRIFFPEDEGRHSDPQETWFVAGELRNYEGDIFSFHVAYGFSDISESRFGLFRSLNSEGDIIVINESDGILNATENTLDITYQNNGIKDHFKTRGDFTYDLFTDFGVGNSGERTNLQVRMTDQIKKPTLLFNNGTFMDYNLGTTYLYLQSEVTIFGEYNWSGKSGFLEGTGWIYHTWGISSSFDYEQWWIQLDGGTNLALFQMVDPQGNPYLHHVVRIEGKEKESIYVDHFGIEKLKYVRNPMVPTIPVAYVNEWNLIFEDQDTNLEILSKADHQFNRLYFAGICTVEGTFMGQHVEGTAFSLSFKDYYSNPKVTSVEAAYLDSDYMPLENFTVKATMKNSIPIRSVYVLYNISYGDTPVDPVYYQATMIDIGNLTYLGQFKNPAIGNVVTFKVIAYDEIGTYAESERYTEVID